jgi:DNA-binding response OmpR family regulator
VYTILLVEDNRETARLMRFLFELEGYRVVAADAYEDILPLLQQIRPNALLMDVNVHGRETVSLVRQVRTLVGRAAETLIFMTSAMDCGPECLGAGADRFILKPFLPDEVVRDVKLLCRLKYVRPDYVGDTVAVGSEYDTGAGLAWSPPKRSA